MVQPDPPSAWPPDGDVLRRRLAGLRRRHQIPALAVALVHGDGRDVCAADGVADLATGRAVERDTVFAWYSLTKVLTATAVVRDFAQAGVDLDSRVAELAPGLVPGGGPGRRSGQRARWDALTVRQLLCHAGGFGDLQLHAAAWFLDPGEAWPDPRDALVRVLARRGWLTRPPGTGYRYSNLGYAVLGEVLAEVTGAPFRQRVIDGVLRPAGAAVASFDPPVASGSAGALARGHARSWSRMGLLASAIPRWSDGRTPKGRRRWLGIRPRRPVFSPHGGLWGPVGDLVPILREHLEAAVDAQHPLHDMQRVHRPRPGRARLRGEGGLGWCVHAGPPSYVSHGGRGPGFTAEMVVAPEARRAVAVLGNATFDAKAVAADLLGGAGRSQD